MKKVLALALSLSLILAIGVAGTLAWLTSKTDTITNTFTIGNVGITLAETTGTVDPETNDGTRTYKVSPGTDVTKDPKVTVTAGSDASYVFVKITKGGDFDNYFTCAIDSSWELLDATDYPGVYYLKQDATTADVVYPVLADNKVTVKDDVTVFGTTAPTLTVTAYAIQQAGIPGDDSAAKVSAAWDALNP